LDVFIDGFAYFSLFPYIIYDHLKCVSRLRVTLYEGEYSLLITSRSVLLRMRNVSGKRRRENQNTHFRFSNFFLKIVLFIRYVEKYLEPDRPQMKIWCIPIACWIPNATNTHSEYVTLIALSQQQWLHELVSLLLHSILRVLFILVFFYIFGLQAVIRNILDRMVTDIA